MQYFFSLSLIFISLSSGGIVDGEDRSKGKMKGYCILLRNLLYSSLLIPSRDNQMKPRGFSRIKKVKKNYSSKNLSSHNKALSKKSGVKVMLIKKKNGR